MVESIGLSNRNHVSLFLSEWASKLWSTIKYYHETLDLPPDPEGREQCPPSVEQRFSFFEVRACYDSKNKNRSRKNSHTCHEWGHRASQRAFIVENQVQLIREHSQYLFPCFPQSVDWYASQQLGEEKKKREEGSLLHPDGIVRRKREHCHLLALVVPAFVRKHLIDETKQGNSRECT